VSWLEVARLEEGRRVQVEVVKAEDRKELSQLLLDPVVLELSFLDMFSEEDKSQVHKVELSHSSNFLRELFIQENRELSCLVLRQFEHSRTHHDHRSLL
jgi:hypothetical protein